MAELPTREELEQLYHEKGHDALVWYAWRNALRALPALMELPTGEWRNYSFVQAYKVGRLSLVLAQWEKASSDVPNILIADEYEYEEELLSSSYPEGIMYDADVAAAYAEEAEEAITHYVYATAVAQYAALIATYDMLPDKFSDDSFCISSTLAARADYDFLLTVSESIDAYWLSQPLWPKDIDNQEADLDKLHTWLQELGLEFLSDDLRGLLEVRPLNDHLENYLKDISEADLNNPEALRHIILGDEADKIHAVRTLLLGPGGAGKSSLADRLQGKPIEQVKAATPGIEYQNHQPLDLQKHFPASNPDQKDLNLYLWDFGGQTIFHGLHRVFLHENCVYILVVDSRHEQAPDEWLHQIRHLAGGNVTVLLVTNQHDNCDIRQNQKRLLREFPDLLNKSSFHYFSCIDPESPALKTFVNDLTKAALSSQKTVWKETLNIHQAIQDFAEKNNAVFLYDDDITQIIHDNGRAEDAEAMLASLEQLGFIARIVSDTFSYCLRPEWAVDHAYEVLYSDTLRNAKGRLKRLDFKNCFKSAPGGNQQEKLREFLTDRSLCFKISDKDEYFFPDAATSNEPETVTALLKRGPRLQIRFDLPYLPLGFHTRLVKPLFNQEAGIKNSEHIWRQGFIMQQADSQAVVQYLLRKSSIEVTLTGNPEHYATLLSNFYNVLNTAVAEGKTTLQHFNIRPFVFLEKGLFELERTQETQVFSVHSVAELIKILQAATSDNLEQVQEGIRAMPADKNSNTTVIINGDGQTNVGGHDVKMSQYVDKSHTEITTDQRKFISNVLEAMLDHPDVNKAQTKQIVRVQDVIEAEPIELDEEKQSKLNLAYQEVKSLIGVANDGIGVAKEVATHWPAITAWLSGLATITGIQ